MADEVVCPLDEVLHIWRVRVAAVMLTPGELTIEQTVIDDRHPGCVVIRGKV